MLPLVTWQRLIDSQRAGMTEFDLWSCVLTTDVLIYSEENCVTHILYLHQSTSMNI